MGVGCVRGMPLSCLRLSHSIRKWCSASCGLLADGIGLFCGPALRLGVQMYVGTITLVLAFKLNSSLCPLVTKNPLAHLSKNQAQKSNKLHLVGLSM